MVNQTPKRYRLQDFKHPIIQPPGSQGNERGTDYKILFPFEESFVPAFEAVFNNEIKFKSKSKPGANYTYCYCYIKTKNEHDINRIQAWIGRITQYVGIRDLLHLSFSLDYDKEAGSRNGEKTEVGELRRRAKPYGKQPIEDNFVAADSLVDKLFACIQETQFYEPVESIVAMTPSKTNTSFNLPKYLAQKLSERTGKENLSRDVITIKDREPLKTIPLDKKLQALEGTIAINQVAVQGKVILIVDDLYQSGVSINYLGMLLLEHGAKQVLGLTCEKTCRNDSNQQS